MFETTNQYNIKLVSYIPIIAHDIQYINYIGSLNPMKPC